MTALKREGDRPILLDRNSRRRRYLLLECLDDVPGSGMFHLTVNLTKVASNTNVFNCIDSFHFTLRIDRFLGILSRSGDIGRSTDQWHVVYWHQSAFVIPCRFSAKCIKIYLPVKRGASCMPTASNSKMPPLSKKNEYS
jgi:hypothetical protein